MKKNSMVILFFNKHRYKFLWVIAILINVKSMFTDFEVDAAYALSSAYRFISGDTLFGTMWEPHQTSVFTIAFFEWVFTAIFGSTECISIFVQLCSVLLYAVVTYFLFKKLIKYLSDDLSHIISLFFFVARPKQLVILEFANLIIMFSVLALINLFLYFERYEKKYLVFSAIFISACVLTYPSLIILYFAAIVLIFVYDKTNRGRSMAMLTSICVLLGLGFIIYVVSKVPIRTVIENIPLIMKGDQAHNRAFFNSKYYFGDFITCFLFCALCFIAVFLLGQIGRRIKLQKISLQGGSLFFYAGILIICAHLFFVGYIACIKHRSDYFIIVENGYGILYLINMILGLGGYKKCNAIEKRLMVIAYTVSICDFIAVLMLTNSPLICSLCYLIVGAMGSLIGIKKLIAGVSEKGTDYRYLFVLLVVIFVQRGLVIREYTNAQTVFDIDSMMRYGANKGIICSYMPCLENEVNISEMNDILSENENLLIVTSGVTDTVYYLYDGVHISHYSTISTTTFDETLEEYWNKYPEKLPSLIMEEAWNGESRIREDSWIAEYIQDNYSLEYQGDFWRYWRRK